MELRKIYLIITLLSFSLGAVAQPMLWHKSIEATSFDFTGDVKTLEEITINVPESGTAIVQFNGDCSSDVGDRILLAASDEADWGVNDGVMGLEAATADANTNSFSHTRGYDIAAGTHTFYAVGQNYVETDGSGEASVYGTLTVRFFPDGGDAMVEHTGIAVSDNYEGSTKVVDQVTINAPAAGNVLVRFDGRCLPDEGDRMVLAASDDMNWGADDENVTVEAYDNDVDSKPFSHTRMYSVTSGSHTFYAVAENYVETAGSGTASIYASLTASFYPSTGAATIDMLPISTVNEDLRGDAVTLGEINLVTTGEGQALVNFDGTAISDPGDAIVLAASDNGDWSTNAGNVSVQAPSSDVNRNGFSHSRVYDLSTGTHNFNAVAENYVNTSGSGEASIYGSLSLEFYPETSTGIENEEARALSVYPNPANDFVNIEWTGETNPEMTVQITDLTGRLIDATTTSGRKNVRFDCSDYSPGMYLVVFKDGQREYQTKVMVQ